MPRIKTLKLFRGSKANMPTLADGEPGFCTDTGELYIGTPTGNKLVNGELPDATSTVKGGVKLGNDTVQTVAPNAPTATAGRSYPVQKNGNGQAVVNVPWSDTDTQYAAMTQAEATTGTATTARSITAKVLSDTIAAKGGGTHASLLLTTEQGVHGIRYWNDKLQVFDGSAWEDVGGGGGVPVGDCTDMGITVGNGQLTIKWKDPVDIVVSGTTIAQWAMTKLVRKTGGYPANENDGTVVVTNTVRNQYQNGYTDTGLTNGTMYYYKLFPVTVAGAVNTNAANNINGTPQPFKTFGVSINLANSNPETAVTYTDDAIGMTGGAAAWDTQAIFKDIKPCMLKNGVVQYYLNPSNFAQKADGSTADITSGNDGDVMIEFPKTGFQISTAGNTLTVKITDDPAKSGFKYYAHTRVTEGDRNKLYIGAYKGSNVSSKLRSLSGKAPHANATISAFRGLATANGAGYDQFAFYPMTLVQCLYLIRFKSLNCQTALGRGYVDGNSAAINTGGANAKGMFFGEATGKQQMKCFGLEDLWGNIFDWIDGLYSDANRNIMTAFQNFNDTGTGAQYTNRGQGATSNIGGYMSKPQGTSETGFIAKEVSGSETTYFSDYAYLYGGCLPFFGGYWNDASNAGVFRLSVSYATSNSNAYVGGRLMYL